MITILTTLLPSIIGFFSAAIPSGVKYLERGQEFKHETDLIKIKMEAARQGLDYAAIIESTKADIQEGESVRQHDLAFSDNVFINNFRAIIRPFLTIFFFLFWLVVKLTVLVIMVGNDAPTSIILEAMWDGWSQATFGVIIGFWFGTRALLHMFDKYETKRETV
jgi:hypothetical protein